jgi:hypothetical protein
MGVGSGLDVQMVAQVVVHLDIQMGVGKLSLISAC